MDKKLVCSFLGAVVIVGVMQTASSACRQPNTKLFATQLNGKAKTIKPVTQKQPDLSSWQGKYSFFESLHDRQAPIYRNYEVRISLARCGWRSLLRVNGHAMALDIQTQVVQLDKNTIGLFYQREQIPSFRSMPFQPGELLLKIRRESTGETTAGKTVTYRVYFEGLQPLVKAEQQQGQAIQPPKSLRQRMPKK